MFYATNKLGSVWYEVQGRKGSTLAAWEIMRPGPAFQGSYGYNRWLLTG